MRVFLEEEPVNCMLVKFKYKTSPGWDALKNGTFPVSVFSNLQNGSKGESSGEGGVGERGIKLCGRERVGWRRSV